MRNNKLAFIRMMAAATLLVAAVSLATPKHAYESYASNQIIAQSNQAGNNTQTGLINIGNAQVNVGSTINGNQIIAQSNQAGNNTQTGMTNIGNAQIQIDGNICELSANCP